MAAIVNIELAEYDEMRNHISELENQVQSLKDENKTLKSQSKIILRKETTLITQKIVDTNSCFSDIAKNYKVVEEKKTLNSSDTYINFKDMRDDIEKALRDEFKRSLEYKEKAYERYSNELNKARKEYDEERARLNNDYLYKNEKLCKEFKIRTQKMEDELKDKYRIMTNNFEKEKLAILNKLPKILNIIDELDALLYKRFFRARRVEELVAKIREIASK